MNVKDVLKSGQATIIDVRTPAEFAGGHVAGSINIPLNEIANRLPEITAKQNIVLCCASGNRSGMAAEFLKQNGVSCENGGAWTEVNSYC